MQEECGISGNKLSDYANTLDKFITILDGPMSYTKTKEETLRVLDETSSMEISNHQLDIQLARIVEEVNELRNELDQVREEAMMDTLTRIANRKAFDLELEQVIFNSRQAKQPFCLLLADIDHFKQFNDTYGHLIGDKVLRFVAGTLKNHIKGNDMVARYGGEEFAIILPLTNVNGAKAIANQLREVIAHGELKDKTKGGSYGKVTISIGITQFRASDLPNELIQRSDKALYLAKDRGRNRVEVLLA